MSNVSKTGTDAINNASSPTTFGRSVESQAQIADAAAQSAPAALGNHSASIVSNRSPHRTIQDGPTLQDMELS